MVGVGWGWREGFRVVLGKGIESGAQVKLEAGREWGGGGGGGVVKNKERRSHGVKQGHTGKGREQVPGSKSLGYKGGRP